MFLSKAKRLFQNGFYFKTGWYRIKIQFRRHFAMPTHFEIIYFKTGFYIKTGCNKARPLKFILTFKYPKKEVF